MSMVTALGMCVKRLSPHSPSLHGEYDTIVNLIIKQIIELELKKLELDHHF